MFKKVSSFILISLGLIVGCEKDKNIFNPALPVETVPNTVFNLDTLQAGVEYADELDYIYSIIIMHRDTLILEEYFESPYSDEISPEVHHDLCSVTKSFTSALIGIAIDQGYLESVNQTMMFFFSEYEHLIDDDRKYDITIEHLLTAQSGFDTDDFNVAVHHPIANAISQPMVVNPGEFGNTFHYSSSNCHILSGILTKATGMSTRDFANQYLFHPLDIEHGPWRQDVDGIYFGGFELMLKPRDMLKFGQLYLNEGMWNGEQIVPANWITPSVRNQQPYTWNVFPEGVRNTGYGYLWWNGYYNNHRAYFANGYGGQNIIVFPELELIVVTTANPFVEQSIYLNQISGIVEWVKRFVLGAMEL